MNIKDSKLKETSDKRRWGWAGNELDDPRKYIPDIDYLEMSSIGTSIEDEDGSSMAYLHERLQKTSSSSEQYQYNKLYRPNQQAVSRSVSVNRPSPPRSKSLGPTSQAYSMYPNRTQSFTSLYDRGYRGTSLDLRPLRSSGSSQGIYFTETEHVPINTGYDQGGPLSMSLQDVQLMHTSRRTTRQKNGRSLLDLSNVTINDSEIDKVSPCVWMGMGKHGLLSSISRWGPLDSLNYTKFFTNCWWSWQAWCSWEGCWSDQGQGGEWAGWGRVAVCGGEEGVLWVLPFSSSSSVF